MPIHDRDASEDIVAENHWADVMHGDIAVLFAEALVCCVWVWIAFDSKAGAVHVVFLSCFSCDVVKVYWLCGDWDLGNDSDISPRSAVHSWVMAGRLRRHGLVVRARVLVRVFEGRNSTPGSDGQYTYPASQVG